MIEKIKTLYKKYREQLLYLIFGGLTTVIDWVISFVLYYLWGDLIEASSFFVHVPNLIAWVAAVTFAFVTNRIWVFESEKRGFVPVMGELVQFAGGRVLTFLMQEGIFLVFLDWLGFNAYIVKAISAVLVIIANYFISKLLVFRKKKS